MRSIALLAYTAGMLDGEGFISVTRRKTTGRVAAVIGITNTDIETLYGLRADWDNMGAITFTKRKNPSKDKVCGIWRLQSAQARQMLSEILPYMRIKRKRAEYFLNMPVNPRGKNLSDDQKAELDLAIMNISKLNLRGSAAMEMN